MRRNPSNAFKAFELDLRSLAAFRIMLGLTLLCDLIFNKAAWFNEMYAADGVMGDLVRQGYVAKHPESLAWNWTLLDLFAADAWRWVVFAITIAATAGFMLGWRTRPLGILAFVGIWSIHQYNPAVLSGPDELLICMLFWSLFLPLDACLALRPNASEYKAAGGLPAIAFILQVAVLYFFNAWLKNGESWQNGNALTIALSEDYWRNSTATWLLQFPELCAVLTHATRAIEYSVAALLMIPWPFRYTRVMTIALMLGLHGTIAIFLNLGLFPMITLTICLALLPGDFWRKCLPRLTPGGVGTHSPGFGWERVRDAALSGLLLLFLWRNALQLIHGFPNPGFIRVLGQSSLLTQNWGFYAPDPSLVPAWFCFKGTTHSGTELDLPSGRPFQLDGTAMAENISYTGGVFFYKTVVYDFYNHPEFRESWPRHIFQQWNANPLNAALEKVEWVFVAKHISPQAEVSAPRMGIAGSWPPRTQNPIWK